MEQILNPFNNGCIIMNYMLFPIASLVSSMKIPPPLGGRSKAEGRVFRGFTRGGFYSLDPIANSPFLDPVVSPVVWHGRITRSIAIGRRTSTGSSKSSGQDRKSGRPRSSVLPKTPGGNKIFLSAYWVKGKPKCKKGYTYNFRRKMCVLDRETN
jgi:hypothetical protein